MVADKRELALHIALPVIIVLLVVSLFRGEPALYGEAFFINNDAGPSAHQFLNRIEETKGLKVFVLNKDEAVKKVERSDIIMVTEIPSNFSEKISRGESPQLIVWRRGTGGDSGQLLLSLTRSVLVEMLGEVQMTFLLKEYAEDYPYFQEEGRVEAFMDNLFWTSRTDLSLEVEEVVTGIHKEMAAFFLPGVITLFIIFSTTFNAQSMVEENERGIIERLLLNGLSRAQIISGKLLGNILRGILQVFILLSASWFLLRVFTFMSFLRTLLFSLSAIVLVSMISIIIGCLSRKQEQALWASIIVTLINSAMGNTFAVAREESTAARVINYFTVSRYANQGIRKLIIKGEPLSGAAVETLVLTASALLLGALFFWINSSEN